MYEAKHATEPWEDGKALRLEWVTLGTADWGRARVCVNTLAGKDPAKLAALVTACEPYGCFFNECPHATDADCLRDMLQWADKINIALTAFKAEAA